MKYLILIVCLIFSSSIYAQEQKEPQEESTEELLKKLHKSMKEASKSMEDSEKELARASLPPARPDVIFERVNDIVKKLKDGKVDEFPESVKQYLKNHPELKDKDLKEIAKSKDFLDELFKIESELENKLEESSKAADSAENVDKAVDIMNKLRQNAQSQDNKIKNNNQSIAKEKEKSESKSESDQKSGSQPADGQGKDGLGNDDLQVGRSEVKDSFKADGKKKEVSDGSSSDEKPEPSKYKGFWKLWCEKVRRSNHHQR